MHADFKMDDGAPRVSELTADATWSDTSLIGILITKAGAVVHHQVKKINAIVDNSTHTEAFASSRAGELIVPVRAIDKALDSYTDAPTFLGTDNKANALLASGQGTATRMQHAARRYHSLLQRVKAGEVHIGWVADEQNPSDFLTKFVKHDKYDRSIEYTKNRRNRVPNDK